jgi:hypothetical protein
MDQGTATVLAAIAAALLSLGNLIVTAQIERRRLRAAEDQQERNLASSKEQETTRWMREELYRNALMFLDSSFRLSGLSGNLRKFSDAEKTDAQGQDLRHQLEKAHEDVKSAQTAIRLLASEQLVKITEECHDAHDPLYESVLGKQPSLSDQDWQSAKTKAREQREHFITQVRQPMALEVFAHRIAGSGSV